MEVGDIIIDGGVARRYTEKDAVDGLVYRLDSVIQDVGENWGRMSEQEKDVAWAIIERLTAPTGVTVGCSKDSPMGCLKMMRSWWKTQGEVSIISSGTDWPAVDDMAFELWTYVRQAGKCKGMCKENKVCDACNNNGKQSDGLSTENKHRVLKALRSMWIRYEGEEDVVLNAYSDNDSLNMQDGCLIVSLTRPSLNKLASKLRRGDVLIWEWETPASETLCNWTA